MRGYLQRGKRAIGLADRQQSEPCIEVFLERFCWDVVCARRSAARAQCLTEVAQSRETTVRIHVKTA